MLKLTTVATACGLAGMVLSGCSSHHQDAPVSGSAGAPNNSTAPGNPAMIAFVTNGPSDYWTICRKGTESAEKELGNVNVQFVMPDDGTAATQKKDVDDLLAKGVKGIAISPVDPANETAYLNTVAAKVNLITSDSDAVGSNRLCYIGTDNHAAGVMAGGLVKEALPQGGKIMVFVGHADAQNAKERIGGLRDALKGTKITILDVRTDDTDHARAKQNAADVLTSTPDIAGLVGIWSYNGPALCSAVKEAGKKGKVQIVAFDQETDTMNGIKDGTVYGTVVQQPYLFGKQSVEMLAKLAQGDKSSIPPSKLIIVPTQAIKKNNLDKYMAEQAKLLAGK